MNTLFSNGVILQQNSHVTISGSGTPGVRIKISTDWNFSSSTYVRNDSTWSALINTPTADLAHHSIVLEGPNKSLKINDVLIGEVWIVSGQSNMNMPLLGSGVDSVMGGRQVQATAVDSFMRFFRPSLQNDFDPMSNFMGKWKSLAPQNSLKFSAIAYAFAKELRDSLQIPIGIIQCPYGGAPSRSWISQQVINAQPAYKYLNDIVQENKALYNSYIDWLQSFPSQDILTDKGEDRLKDISVYDEYMNLAVPNISTWPKMVVPGYWENQDLPSFDGVVWYVRKIDIPKNWVGKDLQIVLGSVDDIDVTYVNQILVGSANRIAEKTYDDARKYDIPADIVRSSSVMVSIRVTDERSNGGFRGCKDGTNMRIELKNSNEPYVNIEGEWAYCVGAQLHNGKIYFFGMPDNKFAERPANVLVPIHTLPTTTFNGMIAPMRGFSVAGVLWHSGEYDIWRKDERAFMYEGQKLLIKSFRQAIGNDRLPFLIAQPSPGVYQGCNNSSCGDVREAILSATLDMDDNVLLISTMDLGSFHTVRPPYKFEEGQRFARLALAKVYHSKGFIANGPIPISATTKNSIVTIDMENADSLYIDTEKYTSYELAGPDSVFYPARATATPTGVTVFSHMVSDPLYVRYAHGNCDEPNTWNVLHIPAPSFSFTIEKEN